MRYAILGDIHGNLEALQAVLEACRQEGVRKYFCVGDIVGYGANPQECFDVLSYYKAQSVAGDHDWAVAGKISTENFNDAAQAAVVWTHKHLTLGYVKALEDLELIYKNNDFVMAHATFHKPESFNYLLDPLKSLDSFYAMDRRVCFIGHTHKPQILVQHENKIDVSMKPQVEINARYKYIINVGSVGQPRDLNPKACYCIFDPDLQRIEIKRVEYDLKTAQKKILEAGLPEILAQRLAIGQ